MASQHIILGVLAIGAGVVVGAALFVPFVAVSYRRRGYLSFGHLATWAAAVVYSWAVWTYTLVPLPDPSQLSCAGVNLNPLALLDDIGGALTRAGGRPLSALTDPAMLQLLLNVLLFMPLGFLIRVLGHRGILVAALSGIVLSAFIETTQLTGVWGIYPCAYRVFDVDDVVTNTAGALFGSLVALLLPRRMRTSAADDPDRPRPVTKMRRLLAMAADWVGFTLTAFVIAVVVQAWLLYVVDARSVATEGRVGTLIGAVVAGAVWLLVTLITGRTVGDLAVRLRYAGGPLPAPLARLLRWVGGIGGYGLLTLLPDGWAQLAILYAGVLLVVMLCTRAGRGLPALASRQRLEDARSDSVASRPRAAGHAGHTP